ncbi:MAG: hypothetical protein RMJ66_03535 [Bacteroidia bacterium]|nr:hypothetical protein [Bacteroidia bacterium]
MSLAGLLIIVGWAFLLLIWLLRFPIEKVYKPTAGVFVWIISRTLLRFFLGLFAVLWWESTKRADKTSFFSVIVAQAGCKEAWQAIPTLTRKILRLKARVGLIVAKRREAYWAIPPTEDSALFFLLWRELASAIPSQNTPSLAEPVYMTLRPYLGNLTQVIWIGHFSSPLPLLRELPMFILPLCGSTPPTSGVSILTSAESFSPLTSPWEEETWYALLFFLSGSLLLLMEIVLYLTRKYLPFSHKKKLLHQRIQLA